MKYDDPKINTLIRRYAYCKEFGISVREYEKERAKDIETNIRIMNFIIRKRKMKEQELQSQINRQAF